MELPINKNPPTIMHIDLNSCFATIEQQANPLLRGKPIAVAAYASPRGCVLAPSIEAKKMGVKVGMRVMDARLLCKDIIILEPDPPKYRDVHVKFRQLFRQYSPQVSPKSIDEAVIDFTGTTALRRGLIDIGQEIKDRIRREIGEWISCNVGIATNRFLAKLAASLHKPDGLDVITHENLLAVYDSISLIDLCGINTRYEARLNANGIFTPVEFFNASLAKLKREIFHSIGGYYWYLRLRGWEIDAIDFGRKSFGQTYSLKEKTNDPQKMAQIIFKLCEKMGRRLRRGDYSATGIHVACVYQGGTYWHKGISFHLPLFTTHELYTKALLVFNHQPHRQVIVNIAVSCFGLTKSDHTQLNLFDTRRTRDRKAAAAMDLVNDRYGEFVITPALMLGMGKTILDRISFGGVADLEELYDSPAE